MSLFSEKTGLCIPRVFIAGVTATMFVIALLAPRALFGQQSAPHTVPVGDPMEAYLRLLSTDMDPVGASSFHLRGVQWSERQSADFIYVHPWQTHPFFATDRLANVPDKQVRLREWRSWRPEYRLATPSATYTWNSEIPVGQNDGAMWQGRGNNVRFSAGGVLDYGPLQVVIRPEFGHSQNHEFDLQPIPPHIKWPYALSDYAQGLARIDMPQRFGEEEITWFHPGQSTIRLRYRGGTIGASTGNIWTGPALWNPLTMSNNAPGFPHLFLGTDGPLYTPAGTVEARLFWGRLRESEWFDENPDNNDRFITAINLSYAPFFLPELSLGLSRTFVEYWPEDGLSFTNLTRVAQRFTQENFERPQQVQYYFHNSPRTVRGDKAIHMLTLFARWVAPRHGFEAWGEWGLNENTRDKRNLLREPVHTRSYVLGMQKRFTLAPRNWLVWNFEMTQLENRELVETADYPVWYEHLFIPQGYTHLGQVIGAGIGPGSNSQKIRVDLYDRRGRLGGSVNRIVHHNDRVYRHQRHLVRNQDRILKDHWDHNVPQYASAHDISEVEFRYGVHALLFLPYGLELQGDLYSSDIMNRHNIYMSDMRNLNVAFTLRWQMPGMAR